MVRLSIRVIFFFNDTATTEIYTLSLHDALPILGSPFRRCLWLLLIHLWSTSLCLYQRIMRSEEHTSELQSHSDLVCRLLLEKKKKKLRTGNSASMMYDSCVGCQGMYCAA